MLFLCEVSGPHIDPVAIRYEQGEKPVCSIDADSGAGGRMRMMKALPHPAMNPITDDITDDDIVTTADMVAATAVPSAAAARCASRHQRPT